MGTDLKVFCVIAISLVLVGVWFFMLRHDGRQLPAGEDARRTDDTYLAMTKPPAGAESSTPRPSGAYEGVLVGYVPESSADSGPGARIAERPAGGKVKWWQAGQGIPSRITPGRTESDGSAGTPPGSSRMRTYRVKHGDSYWSIAKAEYGDGSLYKLLERANTNIPAEALRPKLTVRIPPRPGRPAAITPWAAAAADAVAQPAGEVDKGYYVVKRGEKGFWGVSKAVFKTPKRWQEIAALNPGVDSGSLKPGQRLRIPDGTAATALPAAPQAPSPPARSLASTPSSNWAGTGAPAQTALADGRVFD